MGAIERLTDRERERLAEFVKEAIYLTEEENEAIEHQIPMTQELFEQRADHCVEIGAYFRMTCLLEEYPEFANEYVRKIEEEVENSDIEIPKSTSEELKIGWQNLCKRIRAEFGEDAI